MTYYEILGVKSWATQKEIRKAFLQLSKKWHPDLHPDFPEAEEIFKQITEAYECLKDEESRAYYDRNGKGVKQEPRQEDVEKFILICFEEFLAKNGVAGLNHQPFEMIQRDLQRKLQTERFRIPQAEREIVYQKKLMSRLIYRGEGENPLKKHFLDKIKAQEDIKHNAGVAIDLIEVTLRQLPMYDFLEEVDPSREGSYLPGSGRPRFTDEIRGFLK